MEIYDTIEKVMRPAITDLEILSGETLGDGAEWHDVAATAIINLRELANLLFTIRTGGRHWKGSPLTGLIVFPSPHPDADPQED